MDSFTYKRTIDGVGYFCKWKDSFGDECNGFFIIDDFGNLVRHDALQVWRFFNR